MTLLIVVIKQVLAKTIRQSISEVALAGCFICMK